MYKFKILFFYSQKNFILLFTNNLVRLTGIAEDTGAAALRGRNEFALL